MGKLTVRTIENARPQGKAYSLYDGEGLELRVATDGTKTWRVKYLVKGDNTQKRHTLPRRYAASSDEGHLSLADARSEARAILALAKQGIDVKKRIADERAAEEERRRREQAAREAAARRMTVNDLFERWAELQLAQRKDEGAEVIRGIRKDVLPFIGKQYADEVRRSDVMAILDTVKARGANRLANRLLSEMRQMFSFAALRQIVPSDPTYLIRKRDAGGKEVERSRVLADDEIRMLSRKIETAGLIPATRHAIWAMLATGCRIGELTGARLIDVDLDEKKWRLPDTKNGKPHTIMLSEFACRHMQRLVDLSLGNEWLMPAAKGNGPLYAKSITKQIYDRQRGKEKKHGTKLTDSLVLPHGPWVAHDLRRTASTMMSGRLAVSDRIVEACLNHTEDKLKRTYQVEISEDEKQDAWNRLGRRLSDLTSDATANVITVEAA